LINPKTFNYLGTIKDIKPFIELWFKNEAPFKEIKKGNIEQWLAWAFFDVDIFANQNGTAKVGANQLDEQQMSQIQDMVKELEVRFDVAFSAGVNTKIRSMMLNFDPVHIIRKPLCFNLV